MISSARVPGSAIAERLMRAGTLLRAALREIFEESAYARFLARHRIPNSQEAYAEFLRECESLKARRARCC